MPNWTFLARVCQGTTHLVWSRSDFYNPQQENKLLPSRTSRFPLRNCPSAKSWAGEQAENRLQECYLRLPAFQPSPWCGCLSWAITIYRKICFKYSTLKKKQSWNWLFFGGSHLLTVQLFKWNKFHCTLSVQETFVCSPGAGSVDSGNISCVCPLAGILDPENQSFFLPLKSKVNKHKVTEPVTRKSCVRPGFS